MGGTWKNAEAQNVPLLTKSRKIEGHQNPQSLHIKCPNRYGVHNEKKKGKKKRVGGEAAAVHNMSIDITYQRGGEDRTRRGNGPFMFTEYDVIRAFDAGSVFFFLLPTPVRGRIKRWDLKFFIFPLLHGIVSISSKNDYCRITELIARSTIGLEPGLP